MTDAILFFRQRLIHGTASVGSIFTAIQVGFEFDVMHTSHVNHACLLGAMVMMMMITLMMMTLMTLMMMMMTTMMAMMMMTTKMH